MDILALFTSFCIILFILAFYLRYREITNKLNDLAEALKDVASFNSIPFGTPRLNGSFDEYRIQITPERSEINYEIILYCDSAFGFQIQNTATSASTFFSHGTPFLTSGKKVVFDPPKMNNHFKIYSSDVERAKKFMARDGIQQTIDCIFDLGFISLTIDSKQICIQKSHCNIHKDLTPDVILPLLNSLKTLAQENSKML